MPDTRNEQITKAEAARRLKVSRTMVGKYIRAGLPITAAGRVKWPTALLWVKTNIRPRIKCPDGLELPQRRRDGSEAKDPRSVYMRGLEDGLIRARKNLLIFLPEILGKTHGLADSWKVHLLAVVDHLVETCLALPDQKLATMKIDWKKLTGSRPAEMQKIFDETKAFYRSSKKRLGDRPPRLDRRPDG